jgi:ABC-type multidrug transport system fused ATPase/permease subunit
LQPGKYFEHASVIPAVLLIVIFLSKSFFGYSVYKMHFRFINNVASGLSAEKMLQYLEGRYADYVNIDSASFVRKICFQPVEFAQNILSGFLQMATEIILIILTTIALLLYDVKLLLIVSAVLLPAIGFLSYVTKRRLSGLRKNVSEANERNIQFLHEALSGYVESNVYNKNAAFADRYSDMQRIVNNYIANLQITQGMPSRFFEAFAVIGLFLLILAGLYGATENATGIFTLGAYMAAAYKIIPGISKIINFNSSARTYYYAMDELVRSKTEVALSVKHFVTEKLNSIKFQNVSFSYNSNKILSDFNYSFHKVLLLL